MCIRDRPKPWSAEPSRRMTAILRVLEIARVDGLKTGLIERKLLEPPAGSNHRGRGLSPQIAIAGHAETAGAGLRHAAHARQRRKMPGDAVAAVRFDLDGVTAAQHLAAELGHGAH